MDAKGTPSLNPLRAGQQAPIPQPKPEYEDVMLFQHRDWDDRPDADVDFNLNGARADNWKLWTVKLDFVQQGDMRTGTAFYINLDQKKGRILLTAGHNLISESGEMTQHMRISTTGEVITTSQMFVSDGYKNNPGKDRSSDYGMILLPGAPEGGYGFSLKLAEAADLKLPGVNVIGFHPHIDEPELNAGKVTKTMQKCIKYKVNCVAGNSGGPVWVGCGGKETVIGIHTHGGDPKKGGAGAQGTRIHLGVLQDICRWTAGANVAHIGANVGYLSRRLAVYSLKPPHHDYTDPEVNFYMRFTKGVPTAKVRLGAEDLETTFDVLPGLTSSWSKGGKAPLPARYVFLFNEPANWQENSESENSDAEGIADPPKAVQKQLFLRWRTDPDINRVELSEKLRDDSLVVLEKKLKGFEIRLDKKKLRMVVDEIDVMPPEGPEGLPELYESEQVGFIPDQYKHIDYLYCLFKFA
ncbi:hypothetical protein TWF730_003528 [Orbilia blumenaviensis]|uniref:Serine protease n=1 Tax=Orbilia blumenaviensis TaxID=1796055 RepID=A0AAV9U6X6_9PEZI